MNKKEFVQEIESSVSDVRDYNDCKDWWDGMVDAYIEDGILKESARKWVNPYLNKFKEV